MVPRRISVLADIQTVKDIFFQDPSLCLNWNSMRLVWADRTSTPNSSIFRSPESNSQPLIPELLESLPMATKGLLVKVTFGLYL